ncbi:MAG: Fumble domain-containing protein, partial [Dehalococcoidia bacterium]
MIVVADLGGSNTDVLLADDTGLVLRSALLPALVPSSTPAFLEALLLPLDVSPDDVRILAVTGGRHRRLGEELAGVPVYPVDEIEAIGRGGLATSGCERALIVS